MKAFSDLEQSKKLAEILPIESADMYYEEVCNLPKAIIGNYIFHNQCMEDRDYKKLSNPVLSPAWSLAALLEIIRNNGRYELQMYEGGYYFEANGFMTESYFNLIDACYEMIIKLHELNLL